MCVGFGGVKEVGLEDADKHHEWEISRINHEMAERQEMATRVCIPQLKPIIVRTTGENFPIW